MDIKQIITDYIRRSILTTLGGMVVRGATVPEELAAVALGQVLKSGGVGALPAWDVPKLSENRITMGVFTRIAAGNEVITTCPCIPSLVIFLACDATSINVNFSIGFDTLADRMCLYVYNGVTEVSNYQTMSINLDQAGACEIYGKIIALAANGFTVEFWETTGACTVRVLWLAIG